MADNKATPAPPSAPVQAESAPVVLKTPRPAAAPQALDMSEGVLVVDDDHRIAKMVKDILNRRGTRNVLRVSSGEKALSALAQSQPALVILDIGMPGMDGIEVCRRIKANPATRHVPVMMLTGLGDRDRVQGACAAGADDYITKPFTIPVFLRKVDRFLGQRA